MIILNVFRAVNRIRDKLCSLLFARAFHRFGIRSVISLPVRLRGEESIEIGNFVFVGSNCWLEVGELDAAKGGVAISIGDRTSIAGDCTITAVSCVDIGCGVLIARFVHITDHSHAWGCNEKPIRDQGISKIATVKICDGAWIGHGAIICPGVTIGKNAVVGANSVVKHDVPDYCVAAGIPARIIRHAELSILR